MTKSPEELTSGSPAALGRSHLESKGMVAISVKPADGCVAEVSFTQPSSQCTETASIESRSDTTDAAKCTETASGESMSDTLEVVKSEEIPSGVVASQEVSEQVVQLPMQGTGEDFLLEMLAEMDQHLWCLREVQQRLVHTIELACRTALGKRFGNLALVGSVALSVQTPGSDVDVVCFTRCKAHEVPGRPVDYLQKVWETLSAMTRHSGEPGFSMELINDARVPILRVVWGPLENAIAADLLFDQQRPLDHVRWFQRMHAAPRDTAPPPSVTPLVTVTLRCVKWWLRQRQIPRTKEGGLPTIVWLLMALHTCSMPETHKESSGTAAGQMAALSAALAAFFRAWAGLDALHGALEFGKEETNDLPSEFRHRPKNKQSPWPELSVLDPTMPNVANLNSSGGADLVPTLSPATRLLLIYELMRARERLQRSEQANQNNGGITRSDMEKVFEPTFMGRNLLPSMVPHGAGCVALLLQGDPTKGVGIIELGIIDQIVPKPGWTADFLHRSDTSSELHARTCEVDEQTGHCHARREGHVVLCPCHFICLAYLRQENYRLHLDPESLLRLKGMKAILVGLRTHERALEETQQSEMPGKPQLSAEGGCGDAALEDSCWHRDAQGQLSSYGQLQSSRGQGSSQLQSCRRSRRGKKDTGEKVTSKKDA